MCIVRCLLYTSYTCQHCLHCLSMTHIKIISFNNLLTIFIHFIMSEVLTVVLIILIISFFATDSPVLLSFPHFYMGDQSLRTAVEGISPPEKEKHQFFIDVQPVSGFDDSEINTAPILSLINFFTLSSLHTKGNGNIVACSCPCSNQFGC